MTEQLKQAANEVFAAACNSFGPRGQQSRAQAAAALIKAAADKGLTGRDAHWAASYGMAQFGYGGGL
jgi:nicotinic acid phosphoribosyltransferase